MFYKNTTFERYEYKQKQRFLLQNRQSNGRPGLLTGLERHKLQIHVRCSRVKYIIGRTALLFIAHDLSMVKYISDRVAVMYLGDMVELAASDPLYERPLHPYTEALMSAVPIADPEVEVAKNRIKLEGDLPSPINPPKGCKFSTRCPYAKDKCRAERPVIREVIEGRFAACHYSEELYLK